MKKYFIALLSLFVGASSFTSCSSDELSAESQIYDVSTPKNEFDYWLKEHYLDVYNISFEYRYNDILADIDYSLTPADYDQSILLAKLTLHLMMETYDEVTGGEEFIREYFPKIIQLIGSPAYNDDGSYVLGTAEGGKMMTLYSVNNLLDTYVIQDADALNDYYFHTMHHEFAHILHQTKPYSTDYGQITASLYVGSSCFTEYATDEDALRLGLITRYSGTNSDEDFVEILSTYVTLSEAQWQAKLDIAGAPTEDDPSVNYGGEAIILRKLEIIKNYLADSWSIDIDEVRDVVLRRQTEIWDYDFSLN